MSLSEETIAALFAENRRFDPPADIAANAVLQDPGIYERAAADPLAFWAEWAERLTWRTHWDEVLDWSGAPFAKWFVGGTLNVTESCLDRHVAVDPGKVAFYWEGEPGDRSTITYKQLLDDVCQMANALDELGVQKDDRVAIYMGMVPELPVAMLACARIGAAHSVIFGGFSAEALADRINDAQAKVLITCDGAWRGGQVVPLKAMADDALDADLLDRARDRRRTVQQRGRRCSPDETSPGRPSSTDKPTTRPATECDSEDLLFLLYTSGTTGHPKGIVHTCGGYLTGASMTHRVVFDLHPETDIYWCTADVGWVTGHSYVVYGPLANGATSVLYEGAPQFPAQDRFWEIIERYRVTILYTAPTSIRTFMKWGDDLVKAHDLSSLRILGSVGEPINPEAWMWYRDVVGGGTAPIVDTWWQTETGQIMISPLPGLTTTKPGSATFPMPGIGADVVNDEGASVPLGQGGYLTLTAPWPAMLRGIYGDPERFVETYWSRFSEPGKNRWVYFAGDGAKRDEEGYYWLLGRVDDVMNVSGHRISTLEVESALVDHPAVAEAAVIGREDADHRAGDRRVRDAEGRSGRRRGADRRAARARRRKDRQDRSTGVDRLHPGAAKDPVGEDHAQAAP